MPLKIKRIYIAMAILAAAGLIAFALNAMKPRAKRGRSMPAVPIVSTVELKPSAYRVEIEANGTVIPARQVEVLAEAEGMVIYVNPELVPGGRLAKGEVLLKIDPTDYDLEVTNRKALVAEAKLNLELEKAQQNIARKQWEDDLKTGNDQMVNRSLAFREPHLENALAKLDAAESSLKAALIARDRTVITSPFNALVLGQNVAKGQMVFRQRPVATLVDTDEFWIEVSVPLDRLRWISFPSEGKKTGTSAEAVIDLGGGRTASRSAEAYKLQGELDPNGRMARALFRIPDPLSPGGEGDRTDYARFLLGSFVTLRIEAGSIEDSFSIPRAAMREGDTVWILGSGNTLDIRKVKVAWPRKDDIIVTGGLSAGERLVTSSLQSPLPGMALMPEGQEPPETAKGGGQPE
jgi:RND family efflux transporter MFP subunit